MQLTATTAQLGEAALAADAAGAILRSMQDLALQGAAVVKFVEDMTATLEVQDGWPLGTKENVRAFVLNSLVTVQR
jgi:hypothetical protein